MHNATDGSKKGTCRIALASNAALEWQADTVEINKNIVAACPLEGLVRSDLACRQESRVEFRVDIVNCTQRKWETYREGGSWNRALWDPV